METVLAVFSCLNIWLLFGGIMRYLTLPDGLVPISKMLRQEILTVLKFGADSVNENRRICVLDAIYCKNKPVITGLEA